MIEVQSPQSAIHITLTGTASNPNDRLAPLLNTGMLTTLLNGVIKAMPIKINPRIDATVNMALLLN